MSDSIDSVGASQWLRNRAAEVRPDASPLTSGLLSAALVIDELRAIVARLKKARDGFYDLYFAEKAENEKLHTELARVTEDRDKEQRLREQIERQFGDNCAIVQAYVQAHSLGLGGENIFRLLVRHAEQLRGELNRKRTDR